MAETSLHFNPLGGHQPQAGFSKSLLNAPSFLFSSLEVRTGRLLLPTPSPTPSFLPFFHSFFLSSSFLFSLLYFFLLSVQNWQWEKKEGLVAVMRFRNGWLETIPNVNSSPHMNSTCLLIPGLTRWALYSARGFHSLHWCHLFCRSHLDDQLVLLISGVLLNRWEVGELWAEPVWSPRWCKGTTWGKSFFLRTSVPPTLFLPGWDLNFKFWIITSDGCILYFSM